MAQTMRGYNGDLYLAGAEVQIVRGIKGLLVRKKSAARQTFLPGAIQEVWFQPSTGRWGLPGFVLLVDGSGTPANDYIERVRDERAVTFLTRPDEWRSLADAIAHTCSVPLREFPAQRGGIRSITRQGRTDTRF